MSNSKFFPSKFCAFAEGNCMEAAGINDGDCLEIDTNKAPQYGDAVLVHLDGKEAVKQYLGKLGNMHSVGTQYKEPLCGVQVGYFVPEILGVVTACFRKQWDIETRPRPEMPEPKGESNVAAVFQLGQEHRKEEGRI